MARLIILWAAILAWGLVAAAPLHAASGLVQARNFQADARTAARQKIPVMVIFTSPHCGYCDRVKRDYLIPMHRDRANRNRVLIREVTVGVTTPLVNFDGSQTTHGAFAAAHKVFMVPTVKVLDLQGNDAAEAIVGLLTPDFYYGYLEDAINEGLRITQGR